MLTQKEQELRAKEFARRARILGDSMLELARCVIEAREFQGRSYKQTLVLWYDSVGKLAISDEYAKRTVGDDITRFMAREIQHVSSGSVERAEDIIEQIINEQKLRANPVKRLLRVVKGGKDDSRSIHPHRPTGV